MLAKQEKVQQQVAESKESVKARQEAHEKAAEERKREREERLRIEEERQQKVADAAAALAPKVAGDKERVMQPTKSVSLRVTAATASDSSWAMTSFSDEKLTSDARARVMEALSKAGVLHTAYAQECLLSMARSRPDVLTSDERASAGDGCGGRR
jgi:hypothetical protein